MITPHDTKRHTSGTRIATLRASLCSIGDCGRRTDQPDRGLAGEPELVLFLSIELDLMVRADPCQARPVATNLGRVL
jgi:hypothetical protein